MRFLHATNGPAVDLEWAEYQKYLDSIKSRLPDSLFSFAHLNLHDSRIVSITTPRKGSVSMALSEPAYERIESVAFTVQNIQRAFAPERFVGKCLWGHEVTLSDSALFEIRARLETNELFICGNSFSMTIERINSLNTPPRTGSRK